jgi:hypothetical protein
MSSHYTPQSKVRLTLSTVARAAIEAGYSPHAVREWITVVFEHVAPPAWGTVWRVRRRRSFRGAMRGRSTRFAF